MTNRYFLKPGCVERLLDMNPGDTVRIKRNRKKIEGRIKGISLAHVVLSVSNLKYGVTLPIADFNEQCTFLKNGIDLAPKDLLEVPLGTKVNVEYNGRLGVFGYEAEGFLYEKDEKFVRLTPKDPYGFHKKLKSGVKIMVPTEYEEIKIHKVINCIKI